jgi:hypothetical protein
MTLEERVAALEARIGAADPNNSDPVVLRMSKVQVAMDSVVNWKDKFALWFRETGLFDALVQDVLARVPKPLPASVGFPSVIEQDVVFKGRVGFGGIDEQFAAKVQFVGNDHSMPLYVSNTDGAQYQNSRKHVAEIGCAPDGGVGWNQNAATLSGQPWQEIDTDANPPVPYMTTYKTFIDPTREYGEFRFDSRTQLSLKRREPGRPNERTQDAVFKVYEDQKYAGWELWRPGFRWLQGIDAKYGPARWFKPTDYQG